MRWKLRWQLQAAHLSASSVPSAPAAKNSPQPSTAWPPMPTAWFFKHSRYLGFLWEVGSADISTGLGTLLETRVEFELGSES